MAAFSYAVIGKGLVGSAAARHLSMRTDGVVLIGPDEPPNKQNHEGVFGSHYDEGRITRTVDLDLTWARLAADSIARYRELEANSGIQFFTECGLLYAIAGPGSVDLLEQLHGNALALDSNPESIAPAMMARRFPYLHFAESTGAEYELTNAGHVSPRRLINAQTAVAAKNGASIVRHEAWRIRRVGDRFTIETDGEPVEAERVIVATGAFANTYQLLPAPLAIQPLGRSVCLVRIDEAGRAKLEGMPGLGCNAAATGTPLDTYVLPPVLYPDGEWYVKIGTGGFEHPLNTLQELSDWFRSAPPSAEVETLHGILVDVIPALQGSPFATDQCVITETIHGYPYVGPIEDGRLCVAVGGNGKAAKSSDEIGRLAALAVTGEEWPKAYDPEQFKPMFA